MDKFYQLSKEETRKKVNGQQAAYRPAGQGTPGKIWKE